jgi:hypothetical protein
LKSPLSALPAQYIKVLTRPAVSTFAEEKEKATWGSSWFQLIALSILSTLLSIPVLMSTPMAVGSVVGMSPAAIQNLATILLSIGVLIGTPLSFLVAGAVFYWLGRAFGGDGSYLQQIYTLVLFGVPMVLLSSLLQLIPATRNWLPYLPHIYSLILLVLSIRAVQHVSLGRAIGILVIALGIAFVLVIIGIVVLAAFVLHP